MLLHGGLIGASGVAVGAGSSPAFDLTAGGITFAYVSDGSSNTTISCNVPANIVDGDLMIAIVGSYCDANPATITPPSGWPTILDHSNLNGRWTKPFHIAYRVANSEPSSYEWTLTAASQDDFATIHRVTGVYTASPISGTPVAEYEEEDDDIYAPSIITLHNNALAVFGFVSGNGHELATPDANYPAGTTGIYVRRSRANSAGINHGLASLLVPSAGATGIKTFTDCVGSRGYSAGFSFALRPA